MSPPTVLDALGPGPSPEALACALDRMGAEELAWLDSAQGTGPSVLAAWPDDALASRPSDPDPLPELARWIRETPAGTGDLPSPHLILAAGYDLGARMDRFFWKAHDDLGENELELRRYPSVLIHDGRSGGWWLSSLSEAAHRRGAMRYGEALAACGEAPGIPEPPEPRAPERNFSRESYLEAVREILRLIREGACYQVNLAQRFRVPCRERPLDLYRRLRRISPAPYAAFLDWKGHVVLSSSPELFLERKGDRVLTRPIKGTRPRGTTPEEDARLRAELETSAKDRAELAMIVDLERNDLGRVCRTGSVKVEEARSLAAYAAVHHAEAAVSGTLREGAGLVDLLRASFPGGSVTGCPKLRALEAIDQLEPTRRGIYCGAVGWASSRGACLNLAIRTISLSNGIAACHAGGGIVADSVPEAEYAETLAKASGMLRALGAILPAP